MSILTNRHADGPWCIVHLSGRFIEDEGSSSLHEIIANEMQSGCNGFVVDLAAVQHMNSTGINSIVKTIKQVNREGGKLIFASVPPAISELLTVIKLNAILEIQPSVEDGLNTLNSL
jgi:anti-anti-sigma factor